MVQTALVKRKKLCITWIYVYRIVVCLLYWFPPSEKSPFFSLLQRNYPSVYRSILWCAYLASFIPTSPWLVSLSDNISLSFYSFLPTTEIVTRKTRIYICQLIFLFLMIKSLKALSERKALKGTAHHHKPIITILMTFFRETGGNI